MLELKDKDSPRLTGGSRLYLPDGAFHQVPLQACRIQVLLRPSVGNVLNSYRIASWPA